MEYALVEGTNDHDTEFEYIVGVFGSREEAISAADGLNHPMVVPVGVKEWEEDEATAD